MCDTYLYKQGMFFWIDLGEGTTNTVIPQKKRMWLIVSNNIINSTSSNLTVVPVYTRDEVTKNTHVLFQNGGKNRVVICEDIMNIPRYKIHPSNFAGICSDELWERVHKAILNNFEDDVTVNNVSETVNSLMSNETFKNTIVDAIISLYKNSTDEIVKTTDDTVNTTNLINEIASDTTSVTIKTTCKSGRKAGAKIMDTETSKRFYEDASTMSLEDLNAKYSEYGEMSDEKALSRRKRYISTKLKALGVFSVA